MERLHRRVALLAVLASACTGDIVRPGSGVDGADTDGVAPPRIYRLTATQYRNTVADLFGPDVTLTTELEVDTKLHGYSTVGASELTISPYAAERYEAAALELTGQVFADADRRAAFVGCEPTAADDACVRDLVARFGRRAWRRPLTDAEVDTVVAHIGALATSFGDLTSGIRYGVASMLESPYFLFRVEIGEPVAGAPGLRRYDGYEMAGRLSYLLWNTTPDDALLDAAAAGELDDAAGIRAHAERLLASDRARAAIGDFYGEYLNLERLSYVSKDTELFPQATDTIGAAMRREILALFDQIALADADYREIFTSRKVYVDAELAALYGLPAPAGDEPELRELPDDGRRGGLLGTAGMLALYAHSQLTSPTLRGRFVRQNLLCEDVPPPPPGVVTSLDGVEDAPTLRDKLAQHRADPVCASCHDLMDPIGLGLEEFDAIGALRSEENGYPIDTHGELDGQPFEGARELGALLRDDPRVGPCFSRQLFRYATGQLERDEALPAIDALGGEFAGSGYRVRSLLVALVTSPAFRFASDPF